MVNIVGKVFGNLTVIRRDESFVDAKRTKWICQCECGNVKSVYRDSLVQGRTKSCGCRQYANRKGINSTHNMSRTRIYQEWSSMRQRCLPSSQNAKDYYNRGIHVCAEWNNDFLPFYNWAINNGYNDSLTIDRIDNNKGYSPDNCRWVTIEAQQSNKTNTVYVCYNNEMRCLRSLCTEIGFPYKTAHKRYQKMKSKNLPIDTDKLFATIQTNKIAFKYRK